MTIDELFVSEYNLMSRDNLIVPMAEADGGTTAIAGTPAATTTGGLNATVVSPSGVTSGESEA